MKIKIEFDTNNAAFEGDLFKEVGQVFAQAQRKLAAQLARSPSLCKHPESVDKLLDTNGNTVGSLEVTR
jgi:hypothetical protein